jgi:hypothetical protein
MKDSDRVKIIETLDKLSSIIQKDKEKGGELLEYVKTAKSLAMEEENYSTENITNLVKEFSTRHKEGFDRNETINLLRELYPRIDLGEFNDKLESMEQYIVNGTVIYDKDYILEALLHSIKK